jgi:hypothetical protein
MTSPVNYCWRKHLLERRYGLKNNKAMIVGGSNTPYRPFDIVD